MGVPSRKKYKGQSRKLLLAFDIGTTFSGISYSILDPGKVPQILPVTRYPSQEQVGGDSKIPTVLYYDANGKPAAIGAETLQEGIEADAEENGWTRSRWFKLHLRPKPPASAKKSKIKEEPIPPLPPNTTVIQVFADFMKYLHGCAKEYICDTHGEKLWTSLESDIIYVLTHPNGWGGAQQGHMRKSAILAGLVPDTEEGKSRVHFVTEGEASLHFCLSNGLTVHDDDKEPTGILIVDAGGGTIDLTAYRKLEDNSFTEIAVPKCYFHGSAYVTMRARDYFRKHLGNSRFKSDIETLTTRFDRNTKLVFKKDTEFQHIQFASARENEPKLNIRSGRLKIEGPEIAKFFEPSITAIVEAVKTQLITAHNPIKTVFLVGGFSASPWLYENVKAAIEPLGAKVSRPDTHVNKAVSNGAVSFYLDGAVTSRVSRATYGLNCWTTYDSTKPNHVKRGAKIKVHPDTGKPVLYEYFSIILPKDITVNATTEFRRTYRSTSMNLDELRTTRETIHAYCGDVEDATNLWMDDEPGCYESVCTVEADTSMIEPVEQCTADGRPYYTMAFDIVLMFGLAELKAQIAWKENGLEKRGPASVVFEG
ncbi:hypothetical protein NMY22_g11331 [Coprinellus aureogranulatus]|nr:hypothetical protein NMY22_g11331 [Coprinellus aureogranulatus]